MPSRDFRSALKFYCRQIARLSDWQITRFSGFSDCQISKVEKIYEEIQKSFKLWIFITSAQSQCARAVLGSVLCIELGDVCCFCKGLRFYLCLKGVSKSRSFGLFLLL